MIRRFALCLLAVACRHPEVTHPALDVPCTTDRVGKVIVHGGTRDDVPSLAVLEGTLDNAARTDRVAGVARDALRARGYARAEVSVARRAGCGVELVVSIVRGPMFRIAAIDFQTDDEFPAQSRLTAIEDALGTVNSVGGAYLHDRLQRSLVALARRYQEAGWLEAEIDPPVARFDDARGQVHVAIAIRAGQRYRIGSVVARGGRRTTRAAVLEALGLAGGQWYDARRLRDGIVRARREVDDRLQISMQIEADRIDVEAIVGDAR